MWHVEAAALRTSVLQQKNNTAVGPAAAVEHVEHVEPVEAERAERAESVSCENRLVVDLQQHFVVALALGLAL